MPTTIIMKKSFKEGEKALDKASIIDIRKGEVPIILGTVDDFDSEEFTESQSFKFFIDNGIIYLTGAPSREHELLVFSLLYNSIYNAFGPRNANVQSFGSAELPLFNYRGCHTKFNKRPDLSFCYTNAKVPVLVEEIAVLYFLFIHYLFFLFIYSGVS